MSPTEHRTHFELFQFPEEYRLDTPLLDQRFRELQARIHPDTVAHLGDTEKRLALQRSTWVNEAYQTLRHPLQRARYLVGLHGIDCHLESRTAMPPEFLLEQIEWRGELQESHAFRDVERMGRLEQRIKEEMTVLQASLSSLLDTHHNYSAAAEVIRQLAFLDKLEQDINQSLAELEDE